jgi:hypothetical protein
LQKRIKDRGYKEKGRRWDLCVKGGILQRGYGQTLQNTSYRAFLEKPWGPKGKTAHPYLIYTYIYDNVFFVNAMAADRRSLAGQNQRRSVQGKAQSQWGNQRGE